MIAYKPRVKEILFLLILVSVLLAFIFLPYLVFNEPFMGGYDVRNTYRPFFQEFQNLLNNSLYQRTLPFWSWNTFLGNNFWSSKTFYLIGDIYNYLFVFSKLHYYQILMILTGLKIMVSAVGFYFYGKYRNWKYQTVLIGALLFAFAAWPFKFAEQPMFLSFYSWIPTYFLSIEMILNNKNRLLFVLMVFILSLTNYYLLYTLIIVSILYYVYRYHSINGKLKGVLIGVILTIPFFLLGMGLASVLLIPTVLFMSENNRLFNTAFNWFLFTDYRVYLHILTNLFIPSSTYIGKAVIYNDILSFSSMFETGVYQTREIMAWAGSLTGILVLYGLFDKDETKRRRNQLFYFILATIIFLPIGNAMMHGFSEPNFRWLFFLTFMNVGVAMEYLDNRENLNPVIIRKVGILIILIIVFSTGIVFVQSADNIMLYYRQILIMSVFSLLIVLTLITIIKRELSKYLLILIVFELGLTSYLSFYDNQIKNEFSWEYIRKSESVLGRDYDALKIHLSQFDESSEYYRIYAPYDSLYWYMSLNMNLIYNFSDIKTYDSTYQPALNNLYRLFPELYIAPQRWDIKVPELLDFLSVKYAVVTNPEELPHQDFTYLGEFNYAQVYQNNRYQAVITNRSSAISYENSIEQNDIIDELIVEDKDLDNFKQYLVSDEAIQIKNVNLYQNMLTGTIYSDKSTFLVSSIAYDDGWRVFINDQEQERFSVNGGFLGFPSLVGEQYIKLYFVPKGFKEGFMMSTISFVLLVCYWIWVIKNKRKNVTMIQGETTNGNN